MSPAETLVRSPGGSDHDRCVRPNRCLRKSATNTFAMSAASPGWRNNFFRRHAEHAYSFTDCTSVVPMRKLKLTEAMTTERHFEQAGFRTGLRDEQPQIVDRAPTGIEFGGERGIRTLEGLLTLTPLAGVRLRPLGHLSAAKGILRFSELLLPAARGAAIILKRAHARQNVWPSRLGGEPRAHELLHRLERCIECLGLAPASLRKIGTAAAAAADEGRDRAGELPRLNPRGLVGCHSRNQQHFGRALHARQHHDRRF